AMFAGDTLYEAPVSDGQSIEITLTANAPSGGGSIPVVVAFYERAANDDNYPDYASIEPPAITSAATLMFSYEFQEPVNKLETDYEGVDGMVSDGSNPGSSTGDGQD